MRIKSSIETPLHTAEARRARVQKSIRPEPSNEAAAKRLLNIESNQKLPGGDQAGLERLRDHIDGWCDFENGGSISQALAENERRGLLLPALLQQASDEIASTADALSFLDLLQNAGNRLRKFTRYKIHTLLEQVDLSSALVRLRDGLSRADRDRLLERIATLSDHRHYEEMEPGLRIALVPSEALAFIEGLSDREYLTAKRVMNINTYVSFDSLPLEVKEPVRAKTLERLSRLTKETEAETSVGMFTMRGPRVMKRNLELLHRLTHQDKVEGLVEALVDRAHDGQISKGGAARELNTYFRALFDEGYGDRGHYDAAKIIEVAKGVRKSLEGQLKGAGRYVQIYGSFANGKADLSSSDVDLHLSDALTELYTEALPPGRVTGSVPQDYSASQDALPEALLDAEERTALLLGREEYGPSELLTVVTEPTHWSDEIKMGRVENFGSYNPVVFKMDRNGITLQVYDLFTDQTHSFGLEG